MKVLRCHVGHTTIFHRPLRSAVLLCKLTSNKGRTYAYDNKSKGVLLVYGTYGMYAYAKFAYLRAALYLSSRK